MLQNTVTHHVSFKAVLYGGTAYVVWALPSTICQEDSSPSLLGMALKMLMVQTWKEVSCEAPEPARHSPHKGLQSLSHLASGLGIQPYSLCFALLRELYSPTVLAWDGHFSSQLCLVGELYWFGLRAQELHFSQIAPERKQNESSAAWSAAAQSVPSFTECISKCAAVATI